MQPFRYGRDALCLLCCAGYALNRWILKPQVGPGFFHDHFDDLLLIPAALPLVLWIQHVLRLRPGHAAPTWWEIGAHTIFWSVLFEGIGPRFLHVTGDWKDVAAYIAGAIVAGVWWQRRERGSPKAPATTSSLDKG